MGAYFGLGGPFGNAMGLHLVIETPNGYQDIHYAQAHKPTIKTEEEWLAITDSYSSMFFALSEILEKTKVKDVADLIGRTVKVTLDNKGRTTNVDF